VETLDDIPAVPPDAETAVTGLFAARYPELMRLAGLLGADDPEDIAQEAFARLLRGYGSHRDADAALAYARATVCNLTRNRRLHLRVARVRRPRGLSLPSLAGQLPDQRDGHPGPPQRGDQVAALLLPV
jgi:DNA-directed RNA polymerase specialized sigma24 family protein